MGSSHNTAFLISKQASFQIDLGHSARHLAIAEGWGFVEVHILHFMVDIQPSNGWNSTMIGRNT